MDTTRVSERFLLWSCLVFLVPTVAEAQLSIPDQESCPRCSLELERIVTLRSDDPLAGMTRSPRNITRISGGRFVVTQFNRGEVLVFDSSGVYQRDVGRIGRGPGEYMNVGEVGVVGDSLFVFDHGNGRVTVTDSEFGVIRTERLLGSVYDAYPTGDGAWVIQGVLSGAEASPVVVWRSGVGVERTLATGSDFAPSLAQGGNERRITLSNAGVVWSSRRRDYVIEQLDLTGQLVRQVRREAKWFPSNWVPTPYSPDNPRPPQIVALREIEPDLLVVVVSVAHREWATRLRPSSQNGVLRWSSGGTGVGTFARRLEVLDTRTGQLLLAKDTEAEILGFVDDETVFSYRLDEVGLPFIDIWHVRFQRPPQSDHGEG